MHANIFNTSNSPVGDEATRKLNDQVHAQLASDPIGKYIVYIDGPQRQDP